MHIINSAAQLKLVYFTIMLSFYVLIGLHKVPELLLALLCQKLTEEEKRRLKDAQSVRREF